MARPSKFSPEVRERAVRLVLEGAGPHGSQWAAITSISSKIGCTRETLRRWVIQAERDVGKRPGLTTAEREELKKLQREGDKDFKGPPRSSRALPYPAEARPITPFM